MINNELKECIAKVDDILVSNGLSIHIFKNHKYYFCDFHDTPFNDIGFCVFEIKKSMLGICITEQNFEKIFQIIKENT